MGGITFTNSSSDQQELMIQAFGSRISRLLSEISINAKKEFPDEKASRSLKEVVVAVQNMEAKLKQLQKQIQETNPMHNTIYVDSYKRDLLDEIKVYVFELKRISDNYSSGSVNK